ncbi:LOW QUALITY PROTEIN: hypothetical protein PanWU01x14_314370 [Parasponia andersonii]|uniref:Uncharacterized protein n=1 Tax=Parasponia andersonii TaxID=3476 RepID=A0A2P5ANT3_PARAD|nr:LOW QUALITY PROTEIN: hypothetical protein PanWU01x14_314370 [Parasponia andersonii]
MSNHHRDKEVMFVAQVLFKEFIHLHCFTPRKKRTGDVTDLGCEKAIDCPGNWRTPVVPPPPDRDELHILKINCYYWQRKTIVYIPKVRKCSHENSVELYYLNDSLDFNDLLSFMRNDMKRRRNKNSVRQMIFKSFMKTCL